MLLKQTSESAKRQVGKPMRYREEFESYRTQPKKRVGRPPKYKTARGGYKRKYIVTPVTQTGKKGREQLLRFSIANAAVQPIPDSQLLHEEDGEMSSSSSDSEQTEWSPYVSGSGEAATASARHRAIPDTRGYYQEHPPYCVRAEHAYSYPQYYCGCCYYDAPRPPPYPHVLPRGPPHGLYRFSSAVPPQGYGHRKLLGSVRFRCCSSFAHSLSFFSFPWHYCSNSLKHLLCLCL